MHNDNFTPGEVAAMLGVTTKTVYRAITEGDLIAYRFNLRTVRITRAAMETWLVRCQLRALVPAKAPAGMSLAGTTSTNGDNSKLGNTAGSAIVEA